MLSSNKSPKKPKDNEADENDEVQVDKLSFTSLSSSNTEEELVMSTYQSAPSSPVPAINNDLVLECETRENSVYSFLPRECSSSIIGSTISLASLEPTPFDIEELGSPSMWYPTADAAELPDLSKRHMEWEQMLPKFKRLCKLDEKISADVGKCNRLIYATQLSICAMEEARWYNEMSKDPELSRLIHSLNRDFPLAMNAERIDRNSLEPNFPQNFDLPAHVADNSVFYTNRDEEVLSAQEGVDELRIHKAKEVSCKQTIDSVLDRFQMLDPLRDDATRESLNKLRSMDDTIFERHDSLQLGESQRDNWIFELLKNENPRILVLEQDYHCAECGIKIEKAMWKRMRLCEYYGKMYCQICHRGSKSTIPSKILHQWNFSEYPVSDRAFRFLTEAKDQPVIHIGTLAPQLISKIRVLKHAILLRKKIAILWEFIDSCPLAEETVTKNGNLQTMFVSLAKHLIMEIDLFSLSDLQSVYNKNMATLLEPIVYYGKCHIETCQECIRRLPSCILCADRSDALFPHQLEKSCKCANCSSLAHAKCAKKFAQKCTCEGQFIPSTTI
ncbi:hypothetical protein WR25_26926 [Diploscapter pachys]|uniref:Rubicon Homology domain-containing protein n=1 Tax=Diploscapter pachys TaxID=2018661 RepID=A0A2A2JUN1_9BILA|nr:hypothetical protein WR25_26926 [Diploscapter pachys]